MARVRKSPNIMSITGRMPVMAAPTPTPVKPASEIGVSITRAVPNSSTRPDKTLKGVPASATSSPRTQTVLSRRISSASASRTAWPKVNSRTAASGIYVLLRFFGFGIRCGNRKIHRGLHFCADIGFNASQRSRVGQLLSQQPVRKELDGIAPGLPFLFFVLGAIVLPVDVSDVMTGIAVGVAKKKGGPLSLTSSIDEPDRHSMNGTRVLSIHAF